MQDPAYLPEADYVVMQASLYHALPDPKPLIDRMLKAARKSVIIAEPIRNLSQSRHRWIASLSHRLSDPGDGRSTYRFTEDSLDGLFAPYTPRVTKHFLTPGGREKVFVLQGSGLQTSGDIDSRSVPPSWSWTEA